MDDNYIRRMLEPFRRGRAHYDLLMGLQWLMVMPLLAGIVVPLIYAISPEPVPWYFAWWPIWGNSILALCWIGMGLHGAWVFRRKRLAGFGYWDVLKVVFAMTWTDVPYLSPYPPP